MPTRREFIEMAAAIPVTVIVAGCEKPPILVSMEYPRVITREMNEVAGIGILRSNALHQNKECAGLYITGNSKNVRENYWIDPPSVSSQREINFHHTLQQLIESRTTEEEICVYHTHPYLDKERTGFFTSVQWYDASLINCARQAGKANFPGMPPSVPGKKLYGDIMAAAMYQKLANDSYDNNRWKKNSR